MELSVSDIFQTDDKSALFWNLVTLSRDSGKPAFVSGVYYELEISEPLTNTNVGNFRDWMNPECLQELISSSVVFLK